jgi:hypothetical protein
VPSYQLDWVVQSYSKKQPVGTYGDNVRSGPRVEAARQACQSASTRSNSGAWLDIRRWGLFFGLAIGIQPRSCRWSGWGIDFSKLMPHPLFRSRLSLSSALQHFCCWTQNPVHQEKIARAGPFTSRLVVGLLLRDVALRGMFQGRSAADPKKAHPRIKSTCN